MHRVRMHRVRRFPFSLKIDTETLRFSLFLSSCCSHELNCILVVHSIWDSEGHTHCYGQLSSSPQINASSRTYVCSAPPIVWWLSLGIFPELVNPCAVLLPVGFVTLFGCFSLLCLLLKSSVSWTQNYYLSQQRPALSLYRRKYVLSLFSCF